jgi:hypothetical protein
MILSRPTKFFLFIACLGLADGRAADVDLEKAVGSLITAKKAYAKLAREKGFREASISVFADDAVIFAPNPVNGKKFWREARKPAAIPQKNSSADYCKTHPGFPSARASKLQL